MSRVELTIHSRYVPEWGIQEGVRECLQNALDRQDDGFKMEVSYDAGMLNITSQQTVLPMDAWLLGYSDKRGDKKKRGQFGEGLDLGVLAMVRAGRKVVILNGGEQWLPRIERSKVFESDVLTLYTRKLRLHRKDFTVQVEIEESEWEEISRRYLSICPVTLEDGGNYGQLITDVDRKGWLFCKGIWFATRDDLEYGYNLTCIDLDRDRKMANEWTLRFHLSYLWSHLIQRDEGFAQPSHAMLRDGTYKDCDSMADALDVLGEQTSKIVSARLAREFTNRYGKNVVPVEEQAHSVRLSHYGKMAIVVPKALYNVLKRYFGSYAEILEEASKTHYTAISLSALTGAEREVFVRGVAIFHEAVGWSKDIEETVRSIEIADFTRDDILGTFRNKTNTTLISRKALGRLLDFIGVLLHEKAHEYTMSSDGTVFYAEAERQAWQAVAQWFSDRLVRCGGVAYVSKIEERIEQIVLEQFVYPVTEAEHEKASVGT